MGRAIGWDKETFNGYKLPKNWIACCLEANKILLDVEKDEREELTKILWNGFCVTGIIGDVFAVY